MYVVIVIVRSTSFSSFVTISLWYWAIVLPLALLLFFGTWVEIQEKGVLHHSFFLRQLWIPLENIIRIDKEPPLGLIHTEDIRYYYQAENDTEKYVTIVVFNHENSEIIKFIEDLGAANPNIELGEALKNWIELKKKKSSPNNAEKN